MDKFSEAYNALVRVAAEAHRRKWEHSNNAEDPADNTQAYRDLHRVGELARVARDALAPEIRRRREEANSPVAQLMRRQRAKLTAMLREDCPGHSECERCDVTDPCPCCGLYYDNGRYVLPEQQHAEKGTNAENCPACRSKPPGKIPYPWICPGPASERKTP